MADIVTLELPEPLARQVREIAALTHRRLEDVLVETIATNANHLMERHSFLCLPSNFSKQSSITNPKL